MLAELYNLPRLLSNLKTQTFSQFTLYCCVNNVEGGAGFAENQETLRALEAERVLPIVVIDRSSPGAGWKGKKRGVGWARKVLFDRIAETSSEEELVVSLDADTDFDKDYLQAVLDTFNSRPEAHAFSVPYYHPRTDDPLLDRPLLRYECYMRHYLLQLQRIGSPYAFTALGSAIAFPLWAYRRIGGITPLQGGEDFYLLQKFAKTGTVTSQFCQPYAKQKMTVRPQGRASARVPFGTGPAIAQGVENMEEHYPFYSPEGFAAIQATYRAFPTLFERDVETPMTAFLQRQLGTADIWNPLRKNFKSRELFVHSCVERVDGLRILQFLKSREEFRLPAASIPVNFQNDSIETLNRYRDMLFEEEMSHRK